VEHTVDDTNNAVYRCNWINVVSISDHCY